VIASTGQVPARYRRPLLSAADDLAERLAACSPPEASPQAGEDHGKQSEHGHGKKKGHDKKKDDEQ
jgi:hypothetical protein